MPQRAFVYGATILLTANFFNRVLGFVYQYLVMAYIGGEAYGLFTMVFPIYMMALVLTTAGIPLAVSKMVAEEVSLGRPGQAASIFQIALALLSVSGAIVALALYALAPTIADKLFPDPRVLQVFLICTPAILVVSISSVFRGYFQGLQNMLPTAISQICEQLVRVIVGFSLALHFLPKGIEWAAAGLALGMLAGEVMGLSVITLQYWRLKSRITFSGGHESPARVRLTISKLWRLASPVTLGRFLSTGLSALDAMLIPQRLQLAGYTARQATTLFGQLGGSAFTLLTFPSVFTFALATSLIPAISEAAARKQFQIVKARSTEAVRLTILVGTPCLVVLFYFATPLVSFFRSSELAPILQILALGGIFSYLQQTTTGILQGLGKMHLPVLHSLIAASVRIPLLYHFTALPEWGLTGTAWAYVAGFILLAILNLSAIIRLTGMPIDLQRFFFQPVSAGLGMYLTFYFLAPHTSGSLIGYLEEVITGLVIYVLILTLNGGLKMGDLRRLPWFGKFLPR